MQCSRRSGGHGFVDHDADRHRGGCGHQSERLLLFKVEDARLHGILVTLLAAFIGLVIFMIFTLDHPFRGDLGLTPQPYQLIYDQLMKP